MKIEAQERIRRQIESAGTLECIEYAGTGAAKGGYGRITIRSRGKTYSFAAHRLAYELAHGELPEGHIVRHACHNPKCINPAHLTSGTHKQNAADRMRAGRCAPQRGENNGNAKTSTQDRERIRLRRQRGETLKSIAADYELHFSTISAIARSSN